VSATIVPSRNTEGDRAAQAAASVARKWVCWYAGFVGTEAAERRRAEIDSDLWEQQADARQAGRRSLAVAGSIAWRVVGGMPDDLLWVRTQRLAMRGQRADRKASAMNTLGHSVARWWWVVGAAMLAALFLWIGIDNLVGEYAPLPAAAAQCFIYLTVLVVGIVLRVRAPRLSAVLIAAASLPVVMAWWAPLIVALGLVTFLGATIEVVRRSAAGALPRIGAAVGTLLVGAAAILPVLGLEPDPAPSVLLAVAGAVVAAVAGVTLLVLTRSHAPQPAAPVESPAPSMVA